MTKKLERIQSLLLSTDPELRKLGQKLCHKFRIDYYIECIPGFTQIHYNGIKVKWQPIKYSIKTIDSKLITSWRNKDVIMRSESTLQKIYKIELCKKS